MADTNGFEKELRQVLAGVVGKGGSDDSHLLADLEQQAPALRRFLVEGLEGTAVRLEGKIVLRRNLREIHASIQIPDLEIEALYHSDSWFGLWETIDTDLANKSVQWRPDWKGRQREKAKLDSALRDLR